MTDLSATRTGTLVHLRWTTSASTTDNLPLSFQPSAVICRQNGPGSPDHNRCAVIAKLAVRAGASEAEDPLPAALTAGAPGLLSYRVELFNEEGRSAGRSSPAFAASGKAPAEVAGLVAMPIRNGVRLTWTPAPGAEPFSIELDRVQTSGSPVSQSQRRRSPGPGGAGSSPPEVHLGVSTAGQPDPGGAIDRSAQKNVTYRYVAQRLSSAVVGGQTLLVHSPPSGPAIVTVLDTFPPQPPAALEAVAAGGQSSAIDLSWRPGTEADLAGYNVYRLDPGAPAAWRRLNPELVPVPAYTDLTVQPNTRYGYRITAVDSSGNESVPGAEVQETPETR